MTTNCGLDAMLSLIYVSRPQIDAHDRVTVMDNIRAKSMARNATLEITGVLISTADFFVQLLEGPAEAVDAVMAIIVADPRHNDIRIVSRWESEARRFPRWRMARFERENFGSIAVNPLAAAAHKRGDPESVRRLDSLIDSLARNGVPLRVQ